jgi:diguanylate cyclase (GGDEF)-like protein
MLERTGAAASFSDEEFELIKLFAGHVSIALQNAQTHEATEIKARTDALTGLENQGALHDRLARAVARGAPFSLLLLDLDRFKSFNDRRGHQAGNLLLNGIARALEGSVREADIVFRYGGDEFAIILPNTTEDGAVAVAEKVRQAVGHVPAPGTRRHDTGVTCSIGIAAFPADAADGDGILLAADRACYVAKRAGRDRIATSAEGLALAGEFLPPPPTPVDEPSAAAPAA